MKLEPGRKTKERLEFQAEYAAALRDYAMGGGEAVLVCGASAARNCVYAAAEPSFSRVRINCKSRAAAANTGRN